MSANPLESSLPEVLRRYAFSQKSRDLHFLGNLGGFSGARLWRFEGSAGAKCLRAWPPGDRTPQLLEEMHRLMGKARKAGLPFVPKVFFTRDGHSSVQCAGRLWDVTGWMPGRADFHEQPSARRLEAAVAALAQLHQVWAGSASSHAPCPAVRRRLDSFHDWDELVRSGWKPAFVTGGDDPVQLWAERAWRGLQQHLPDLPRMLTPWADRVLPLQPCLCDVWHDHVLFEGDKVTGLIDYGSVKMDHVTVDLARLLGSLVGDSAEQWQTGLRVYRQHRPLSSEEEALASVLDWTGTLLGAANWLKWLYWEKRHYEDRTAVARRLAALVERISR